MTTKDFRVPLSEVLHLPDGYVELFDRDGIPLLYGVVHSSASDIEVRLCLLKAGETGHPLSGRSKGR